MDVPGPVESALGEEAVAARVPLGGDDALYVTRTRTLVYKGDGLLSGESVASFPHDAERVAVSEGRRKTELVLDYGVDGEQSFAVPGSRVEEALHPVLAGVLSAADVTGPGETVTRTYRFSELTLVVTSGRVVKHVGEAVWDDEFEEIEYADVTGLGVEEGNVASQLVIETTGRPQRIKAPNDEVRAVRERVEDALLAYHDVDSYEEFEALVADDDVESAGGDASASFESDLDPIDLSGGDGEDAAADAEPSGGEQSSADAGGDAVETGTDVADAGTATAATDGDAVDARADAGVSSDAAASAGEEGDAAADDAPTTADGEAGFDEFESAMSPAADAEASAVAVEKRLRALRDAIDRQRELLDEQEAMVEELAAELERRR